LLTPWQLLVSRGFVKIVFQGQDNDKMKKDLYEILAALRKQGAPAVLATVIRISGSSPGKPGFKMLVSDKGEVLAGTVGGGILEAACAKKALQVLGGKRDAGTCSQHRWLVR